MDGFRSRFVLATLAAVLLAGIVAFAKATATQESTVAGRVDKVFERWNTRASPGCAIAIGQDGRVALKRAYGVANLEDDAPIRTDTIFEAGSVSKQFTAAAIALLVQEGKVSLDDPVRKYLPEVPDFGTPVLIRHLLTHTSGLRSQWPLLTLAGRPPGSAVHTIGEILDLVSRQKRLNFAPGEEFLYNNTGFTLLGVIVQRASGQTLQAFSEARLFKPLGMAHTAWRAYYSDELDVKYDVWMSDAKLALRHRPEPVVTLDPAYAEAFDFGESRVIRFTRDQAGKVDGLEIFAGRVRHLRFVRFQGQ